MFEVGRIVALTRIETLYDEVDAHADDVAVYSIEQETMSENE